MAGPSAECCHDIEAELPRNGGFFARIGFEVQGLASTSYIKLKFSGSCIKPGLAKSILNNQTLKWLSRIKSRNPQSSEP